MIDLAIFKNDDFERKNLLDQGNYQNIISSDWAVYVFILSVAPVFSFVLDKINTFFENKTTLYEEGLKLFQGRPLNKNYSITH